jgi:hypothetical protein
MSAVNVVFAWIFSFIVAVAPPGRKVYYPEAQETQQEAEARYMSIAQDVVSVVYAPGMKPLFRGPSGRAQTVSVILSVMFHEGSFMKNVDFGLGKYARGDGGRSWCLMQIKVGNGKTMPWNIVHDRPKRWNDPPEEVFNGYTGEELVHDRKLCISEGLKILRLSFGQCSKLPMEDRLRSYASGSCEKGEDASRNRMRQAMNWFAKTYTKQLDDATVMSTLPDVLLDSSLGVSQDPSLAGL